ncbi:xanthine dehydrogenase family protein subunit M [Mycobacterium sp. CVI_P3]|uniref:Xanthine dehydrogenase family protein subunit M n=1 Tax=Mycobacterium pinniadriaticum TaxID=2994102 RepID=A0ABT3SJ78_9MYCO|nr:xanthine dehydrogenase family protein subunit M [Mycobacterium pinniadriaticum]MCX2933125.1 xanthine dehydrogenase family protein subunit M [Mycobacterium pinniadriaticum]MCX2939575.1 xanthine dehydrogenase family protein subunit M [Mycobacterium pinniadriaticum]
MKTFEFHRASSVEEALNYAAQPGARFLAGGTNLVDLMKCDVERPSAVVDINRLDLSDIEPTPTGGVMIGALATNTAVANHPLIRGKYPVLSHAILSGATTQIRNRATAAGNLMQRTRCRYFMDPALGVCNKRRPGSGCAALAAHHREHAVFGASPSCVAVHPSDMAVALTSLDATIHIRGDGGVRTVGIDDFFRLPGQRPDIDNAVRPGELITGIELPARSASRAGWYLKVRDRHSYAFALVSVATVVEIRDGVVVDAAIALGAVAATPWRVPAAEHLLRGNPPSRPVFEAAAAAALAGAQPLPHNGFKVDLGVHSVVRALTSAAEAP